ncbi:hypothetical protein GQ53DRAFT_223974 [Thozetella sp. PMI_491]|nr:hypothetical protein GQ53DRAFT_223974 [Thozetella sp. PMI_491]
MTRVFYLALTWFPGKLRLHTSQGRDGRGFLFYFIFYLFSLKQNQCRVRGGALFRPRMPSSFSWIIHVGISVMSGVLFRMLFQRLSYFTPRGRLRCRGERGPQRRRLPRYTSLFGIQVPVDRPIACSSPRDENSNYISVFCYDEPMTTVCRRKHSRFHGEPPPFPLFGGRGGESSVSGGSAFFGGFYSPS